MRMFVYTAEHIETPRLSTGVVFFTVFCDALQKKQDDNFGCMLYFREYELFSKKRLNPKSSKTLIQLQQWLNTIPVCCWKHSRRFGSAAVSHTEPED